MSFTHRKDNQDLPYLETHLRGRELLTNPLLNKNLAFTESERETFDLLGLLPPQQATLEEQRARAYQSFQSMTSDLAKYINLKTLQDSNEVLFYSLLTHHLEEMLPIIYTPTVGDACQQFSRLYRVPRGLFIAYPNRDKIEKILSNPQFKRTRAIVVTDGERILGLGDQGAGGMGIPIGKLALYTACGGIHPSTTLPIILDVGTNNEALIKDPLYIGWKHERIRGQDYYDFVDAFVSAVKKCFPNVLLQWEDFAQQTANPILERYRDELTTFNDDIQGTAAVATGAILSAIAKTDIPPSAHKIVVFGGGSAGCGISQLLTQALINLGISPQKVKQQLCVIDKAGLLLEDTANLLSFQKSFAQSKDFIHHWKLANDHAITLSDVIHNWQPTVLIGVSGQPGSFQEAMIRTMAQHTPKPIIFPLSNPTSRCEATPKDLLHWTNHKAIISTGSPFAPVTVDGQTRIIDQTNNAYIFPGMALGIIASGASRVSDNMFMAAALALAAQNTQSHSDAILPPISSLRSVSFEIARAVAKAAIQENLAPLQTDEALEQSLKNHFWEPAYLPFHCI